MSGPDYQRSPLKQNSAVGTQHGCRAWWDEDRNWMRRPGLADWYAQLTSIATSVLRLVCGSEQIQLDLQIGLDLSGLF